MSHLTEDLITTLLQGYRIKLKELKLYKHEITLLQINNKLKIINEIQRLFELLKIIILQKPELDTILNCEI